METDNNLALDLLWIFREILFKGDYQKATFADAVARYLLIHLGLSIQEVDTANQIFWQKVEAGTLGDLGESASRIANFVKESDWLKNYIISSMATIITVQGSSITDDQIRFINAFRELFDMRPSQFKSALSKGDEWGIALRYIADEYAKFKGYVKQ